MHALVTFLILQLSPLTAMFSLGLKSLQGKEGHAERYKNNSDPKLKGFGGAYSE